MRTASILLSYLLIFSSQAKMTNDFLFVRGDIGKIDLTRPVFDGEKMNGIDIAWAMESLCERSAASGVGRAHATFDRCVTAEQMNSMLAHVRELAPNLTSLYVTNVFPFVKDSGYLFGSDRYKDIGYGRYQDDWEASHLYGREVSRDVNGSPFYSSSPSVRDDNYVFVSSYYTPYIRNLSVGDDLDFLLYFEYAYAWPLRQRLVRFARHLNQNGILAQGTYNFSTVPYAHIDDLPSEMSGTELVYGVMAGYDYIANHLPDEFEIFQRTVRQMNQTYVYRFENAYSDLRLTPEAWFVFRVNERVWSFSEHRETKNVAREVLVRSVDGGIGGYQLVEAAKLALQRLSISDSDIVAPSLEEAQLDRQVGYDRFIRRSFFSVNLIGCYVVFNLRDRTITDWYPSN